MERATLRLEHPVVRRVDPDIFRFTFAPDCLEHACVCHGWDEADAEAGPDPDAGHRLDDACCRFGCDVDLYERDRILARAAEIAQVLPPHLRNPARWFDEEAPEIDTDTPSGVVIRTARHDMSKEAGRCVFLQRDRRGCALHRAAVEAEFAPSEIKPVVCRLYPLSMTDGALGVADDFDWYSCAHHDGPTLYRVMRDTLLEVYGPEAIAALDDAEAQHARRRLRVTA
jgi:Fe-S-cluster containining protein